MVKFDLFSIFLPLFRIYVNLKILKSPISRKVQIFLNNSKNEKDLECYHLNVCGISNEKIEYSEISAL